MKTAVIRCGNFYSGWNPSKKVKITRATADLSYVKKSHRHRAACMTAFPMAVAHPSAQRDGRAYIRRGVRGRAVVPEEGTGDLRNQPQPMEPSMKPMSKEEFFAGVETAPNAPLVIAQYGFKKVDVGGKIYLQAMTREERQAIEAARSPDGKAPLEYGDGCHAIQTGACQTEPPGHCRGQCAPTFDAVLGLQCYCR
ncbi:hypothetical protein LFL96_35025 (plasmid) [Paraburkholderia sp. D15]|uniref:hypothetical protein n=1 Tax=Paraburkholderia sp. D15 TaxID=2880218 RepID=UPI00247A8023|nr:hypothetical protein [Paraburkholderia sp. D15]WGS55161.1 hypothetical protein LFL96_35025 [Paraburkholderia sp. D15]